MLHIQMVRMNSSESPLYCKSSLVESLIITLVPLALSLLMCRFYFLGDDDLLEILGQPSNPAVIQCHLNKLFAGIHSVSLNPASSESKPAAKSSTEAGNVVAMVSVDREEVPFPSSVAVTAVVEEWLAGVCSGMRHALQVLLPAALQETSVGGGLEPGSSKWAALPAQVLSLVHEISFAQVGTPVGTMYKTDLLNCRRLCACG